jgi:DNA-binding LacI/PurR family transcriptional regulator
VPIKNVPNIQMICDRLGLSKATVSKALNGYAQVNANTREAVLRYAQEIGYRADKPPAAQGAAVRRIGMPGRVTGSDRADFSGDYQMIAGFRDEAHRSGMEMILLPTIGAPEQRETPLAALLAPCQLDGLLLCGLRTDDPYLAQLADIRIPTVLWDLTGPAGERTGTVRYDSLRGAQMAVEHLIRLGHRRIALFNGHRFAQVSHERLDGYRLALAAAGIALDPSLVVWGDFTENGVPEAVAQFMQQGATAVFCACDTAAVGVVRQLKAIGKKVPGDVSVVGYDDSPVCVALSPALTTVSQDFYRIGQIACGMMNALLLGFPLHNEIVMPWLTVRSSTGPAPGSAG